VLAIASASCEQLAVASALARSCELGRPKLPRCDVAQSDWSKESTRNCEWCSSQLRVQAGQKSLNSHLLFLEDIILGNILLSS
jgi:hypothetical protein